MCVSSADIPAAPLKAIQESTETTCTIKELRKQQKVSLCKLAEMTAISKFMLSDLEVGTTYPKGDELERTANVLGVEADSLYTDSKNARQ
jgi:transcriptional regulator with XRE-family HTH domain